MDNQTPNQYPDPGLDPGTAPPPPPPTVDPITPGLPPPPVGQNYGVPPQPMQHQPTSASGINDVTYVTILHLSPLIGAAIASMVGMPFLNFIAPLAMWLFKKNESRLIDEHGKESVNFNITVAIASLVLIAIGFIFTLITFGIGAFIVIPVAVLLAVAYIAVTIIGAIKANNGELYRYPLSFRFIK